MRWEMRRDWASRRAQPRILGRKDKEEEKGAGATGGQGARKPTWKEEGWRGCLPREVLVPAALIGPAHMHPKKSVTTLKKETNAPVLFAALFVN